MNEDTRIDNLEFLDNEIIKQLIIDAVAYCDEHYKGGVARYKAAFDCYMKGASSVLINHQKFNLTPKK